MQVINTYTLGFLASFLTLALQTALVALYKFFFAEFSPIVLICIMLTSFAVGTGLSKFRQQMSHSSASYLIYLALVLTGIGLSFFSSENSLLIFSALIMLPCGFLLNRTFVSASNRLFYFGELAFAMLGIAAISIFLTYSSLELFFFNSLCLISGANFLLEKEKKKRIIHLALFALPAFFGFQQYSSDRFNLVFIVNEMSEPQNRGNFIEKNGWQGMKAGLLKHIDTHWSIDERIDVYQNIENQELALYSSNSRWSTLASQGNDPENGWLFPYFPTVKSLLDIGPGGGITLQQALDRGIKTVGVELNEATYSAMTGPLAQRTNHVYERGNVILGEGRHFLNLNTSKFDMITILRRSEVPENKLSGINTNYLHTSEGINQIVKNLNPGGFAVWQIGTSWFSANIEKLAILSALKKSLSQESCDKLHQCIYITGQKLNISHNPNKVESIIIAKKGIWSKEEISRLNQFELANNFEHIDWQTSNDKSLMHKNLETYLEKVREIDSGKSDFSINDKVPSLEKEVALKTLWRISHWFLPILFIIVLFSFFKFGKEDQGPNLWQPFCLIYSGFSYGLTEIILLRFFELSYSLPVFSFLAVSIGILAGSCLCSLLSAPNRVLSIIAPMALIALFILGFQHSLYTSISPLPILISFLCGLSLSILFLKLLNREKNISNSFYSFNIVGFSIGTFSATFLATQLGTTYLLQIAILVTLIQVLLVFLLRPDSSRNLKA